MTITAGARLGPFDVIDFLGAGGMGAVCRARDGRLRREVAIKVLPPAFSGDPDRLRRFEQEALAAARLAHPNIVAVHDVGTHDGAPYIVIGRIKILDFGLAKLIDVNVPTDAAAVTLTAHGFAPLGTAGYMAPEQARGARADHRADLFSLGVVLYEMVAGRSPFRGPTAADTVTAILRDEAPELPETVACPPALRRIVRHCLEKDPAARFQSARDLAFDLESLSDAPAIPVAPARRRFSNRYLPLVIAGGVCAAAGAGFVIGRRTAKAPGQLEGVYRLTDSTGLEEFPAIAPDLKSVAFTARVDGHRQVFVRLLAGGTPLQITKGAIDHEQPRWSRDATSIVYFSPAAPGDLHGTMWEVPALGGAPRRVIDSVGGGDVGPDGRIVCFRVTGGRVELIAVSPDGADVRTIARFAEPVYYKYPRWSPDAECIAFQRGDGVRWDLFAIPAGGGEARQLTHDNGQIHGLAWMPGSERLIYSSSRGTTMPYLPTLGLWEAPLDGGEPRRIAAGVTTNIWALSTAKGEWRQIVRFGDRPTFIARRVSWSPDGRSVLAAVGEGEADIILLAGSELPGAGSAGRGPFR